MRPSSGRGIPVMALPHARAVFLCWRQFLPETSVQGGWYHSNCSTHLALPHKPRRSYSALPGATAVCQSLAQGHSCLLSPKGGQHLIFICHLPLLPPGAPPSLTRREAITSTLYIHLPSIHRVELIAGCICPSFRWVRMKPSDPSLPGVVHLDLS